MGYGTGALWDLHNRSICIIVANFGSSAAPMQTFGVMCPGSCGFYPRPVLAFGYCRCLRLCVCVCVCVSVCLSVCQSLACPGDNSGPVQARITKFGPKMQKTLVKVPIVLGGN